MRGCAMRALAICAVAVLAGSGVAAQPMPRQKAAVAAAQPMPRPKAAVAAPEGAVCGDPTLRGVALAPIDGDGPCGVGEPVRLSAADGIALDPPATVDCTAARALSVWLRRGPVATFARQGAAVRGIVVVDAYSCRNRNRAASGKLSEHAFGRAIDIAGFELRDGRTVTVRDGWGAEDWAGPLRRIHDAGCGAFATVLGPEANALHVDHLHLDMAVRRSGPYCE